MTHSGRENRPYPGEERSEVMETATGLTQNGGIQRRERTRVREGGKEGRSGTEDEG